MLLPVRGGRMMAILIGLVRDNTPEMGIDRFLAHRATLDLKANLIGDVALIFDTKLLEKIIRDRRRQTPYQGVVEQLRAFHRKAVSVKFEMINIEVL